MFSDPVTLVYRVFTTSVKIAMYTVVFSVQVVCYAIMLKKDKIVDAFGYYGRGVADAIADLMRK
jgi:hypothetical protein